jgi:hypothetical protein
MESGPQIQVASSEKKEKIDVTPRVDIDMDDDAADDAADAKADSRFEPTETSCAATCVGLLCLPFTLLCSWYVVNERQEIVQLNCGKYVGTEQEPGCHFANCVGFVESKILFFFFFFFGNPNKVFRVCIIISFCFCLVDVICVVLTRESNPLSCQIQRSSIRTVPPSLFPVLSAGVFPTPSALLSMFKTFVSTCRTRPCPFSRKSCPCILMRRTMMMARSIISH